MLPLYWRRFNGVGFASGLAGGVLAAASQRVTAPHLPPSLIFINTEWGLLLLVSAVGFAASLAGAWLSQPTPAAVLERFYLTTLPFGYWQTERDRLSPIHRRRLGASHCREIAMLPVALTYQVTLYITPMVALLGDWTTAGVSGAICIAMLLALWRLYFAKLDEEAALVADIQGTVHHAGEAERLRDLTFGAPDDSPLKS
jgi:hypothetical protein